MTCKNSKAILSLFLLQKKNGSLQCSTTYLRKSQPREYDSVTKKYRFSANKKMKNNEYMKMKNNKTHGNKWRKDLSLCLAAVWILAEELEMLTVFSGMCHCWNDVFNHTCEEEDKRKKDVNTYQGQNTEEMLSIRAVLVDSMYDLSGLANSEKHHGSKTSATFSWEKLPKCHAALKHHF